jgi:hypothetical protein
LAEVSFPTVDGSGCVRVSTNFYSTPVPAGRKVQATTTPDVVEIWYEGQCTARHERCDRRKQQTLNLEHYLEVLEGKPGALEKAKTLSGLEYYFKPSHAANTPGRDAERGNRRRRPPM